MKRRDKDSRTLREDWAFIWRGVKIWNKIMPYYWGWCVVKVLAETFSPYFGLFMSAQMVNELAGACDLRKLLILAAITVAGGFAISLATRALQNHCGLLDSLSWQRQESYMVDMQNRMQFEHLENPDVVLMRSKISAELNSTGGGLPTVLQSVPNLLRGLFNMIFSVSLTVSMFTLTASGEFQGFLKFINSPFSALMIVAVIIVNAFLAAKITTNKECESDDARSGVAEDNVRYGAYMNLWGADMTVFKLHRIVIDEIEKYQLNPPWLRKLSQVSVKYNAMSAILDTTVDIAVYLFVALKAFIGTFGIGNLILYQGTIRRFIGAIDGLSSDVSRLRYNNRYLIRLYEYLDLPNDMYQGTLAVEKRDDIDYQIEFRDVSFKYPRTDFWALRHVNLTFKIGDKLAIVGENGSGKTTFIKLLCRLYDPTEGKILLNGIDITRYRYDEYMALFSVVFQDYTLFDFPLGEIVAANLDYDEARVRDCLIRAGMEEKILSLDADDKHEPTLSRAIGRGYDAEGIELSGGERQKTALARALYKDAPFVLLDEPTAALDPIAEAAVYENFNRIANDKTSVFISHRLSSCRFCDTIAVFDQGRLVQNGNHEALVTESGKYQALWFAQAQYYDA